MSTIKQDRKDLELLLNGIDPVQTPGNSPASPTMQVQQPVAGVVDNTSDTSLNGEKIFEFDYDALKKTLRKKARKTVVNITRHILPEELLEEDYVKDKMEQDIDTFTDLYMQVESNNIMQRSILDTVSRGNTMPRMYEVFSQLTDKIQAVNKQIVATEQQLRKTYLDLKFEIKDKEAEQREYGQTGPALAAPQQEDMSKVISSSSQLIQIAKQAHRDKIMNAKETTCIVEQ